MSPTATSLRRTSATWVGLALWFATTSVIGAYLLSPHLAALPTPSTRDARFTESLDEATADARGSWALVHFLLGGCDCSEIVSTALMARPPRDAAREWVFWIGSVPHESEELGNLGYTVQMLSPPELRSRFGLESAPVLAILDPSGVVRYVGGHSTHRRSGILLDRQLLSELARGEVPAGLPVLGCAASADLRRAIDPLGLRPGPSVAALRGSEGP